jgi:CHAT domain-containing protein
VFIGSHWDVTDDLALQFATVFYERTLAGDSIAKAVRTARLAMKGDGSDPTWRPTPPSPESTHTSPPPSEPRNRAGVARRSRWQRRAQVGDDAVDLHQQRRIVEPLALGEVIADLIAVFDGEPGAARRGQLACVPTRSDLSER